jgi:hypothetical protein
VILDRKNSVYYLCQLVPYWFFFIIGLYNPITEGKTSPREFGDVLLTLFNLFLCVVISSHFITRKQLKKRMDNISIFLCLYLIFIASLLSAGIDFLFSVIETYIFNLPGGLFEKDSWLPTLLKRMFAFGLAHTVWLLFYLAITSIRNQIRLKQQLVEQQLANLTAQINPELFFNSLTTIQTMVSENKEKAADLITKLSNLIRYNLTSDKTGVISLEKELDICEQYLAIEQIRLRDKLKVEFVIAPVTQTIKIPTMILLTLAESAIKNGIEVLKHGCVLTIESEVVNGKLLLSVSHPYDLELVGSRTDIELENIKKRINSMYFTRGQFCRTITGGYLKMQISLPCETVIENPYEKVSVL